MAPATLYSNIGQLVCPLPSQPPERDPIVVARDKALLVRDGVIAAVLSPGELRSRGEPQIDLGGRAVVPGFVDSHTHVLFAADRIDEMARRARGASYEDIARAGGGIAASAEKLAAATPDDLIQGAARRLDAMLSRGTTTCEIKSGYGLQPHLELKQLNAIKALAPRVSLDIRATALAHVIPAAAQRDRAGFVARFCREVLAVAAATQLCTYADVFVEQGAYDAAEARVVAEHARRLGLPLKLHVDQMRDGGGAELAAELGALSADHLEHTSPVGRRALAKANVVATILPGCALFLGKGPWPNGRALRDAGCEVAIATDCNPGSSMITDLLLCATLAVTQGGLTLEEALWGITRGGAKALGLDDRGCLRVGERADFVVVDHVDWRALLYHPGNPPIHGVAVAGRLRVHPADPRA